MSVGVKANRVFLIGCPGPNGGANTEAMHTIQLWRRHGAEVLVMPTWGRDQRIEKRLAELGCHLHFVSPRTLNSVAELPGSPCVMICNRRGYQIAAKLQALNCRNIHVPCMCFLRREEELPMQENGAGIFYRTVFQSAYQRGRLEPRLIKLGYRPDTGRTIHGAFAYWDQEWKYAPRRRTPAHEPFVVGKLARANATKWSPDLFRIWGQIPNVRGMAMGIDTKIRESYQNNGGLPKWVTPLKPQAMRVIEFFRQLHCLCPPNGRDEENWPRVGLEAMALGVPVVAERKFGWVEMVDHGTTGLLAETAGHLAAECCNLERDEEMRLELTRAARERLETDLAQEDRLWEQWSEVLWG